MSTQMMPVRYGGFATIVAIASLLNPPGAAGQTSTDASRGQIRALRTARPPLIDGDLNDESWAGAEAASGFTQRDPDEGKPATERTEVRVLYDDAALYFGVRLFDSEAARIARRLSPRDSDADADLLSIYLDPMHDHLTGAIFRVSASNVQQDAILYNDTWWDRSWDAVWESQVSVDERGWSVEVRLPLSQLRFPASDVQTWGFNVERFIRRKNESVWLEMVPKNENGTASRMLHLTGLDGLRPARNLELLPYTAARAEFIKPDNTGNPFNDGSRTYGAVGLDVKWGLTSNLTLNATVNPDFGQVEVDPAVINLTAFETFFQEKRNFFLEGSQILTNFGYGGSNNYWGFNSSDPSLFYSRRIGRAPQVSADGDFTDPPAATTILGAAKLTGKTPRGWSIGLLEAVTGRETARTETGGLAARAGVEPLTNYFVARVHREMGKRAGAGFIATAVNRRLDTQTFKTALADQAYVFGGDAHLFFDEKRDWVLTGKGAVSRVSGSPAFLDKAQRAPQRYYQRPDAPQVTFNENRTSLAGWNGRLNLNRNSGLWQVNGALWGVSPGFESNDLGFHFNGDRAGGHAVILLRDVTPDRFTRSRTLWAAKWWTWNFNRELLGDGWNASGFLTFTNYWGLGSGFSLRRQTLDDRLTRGGPSTTAPAGHTAWLFFNTDSRKWFSVNMNNFSNWTEEGGWNHNLNLAFNLKPSAKITISTGPQWSRSRTIAQYVKSVDDATALDTYGGRYVFGELDQTQLSMTTRLTVILTPTISLQVFTQPLLGSGDYQRFKELARPRSFDFLEYGSPARPITFDAGSNKYTVDPDAAGAAPAFTFDNPDFNTKSLRVNAVFRWEMKPGSTFYAVWTRQQQSSAYPGTFDFGRDARAMFFAPGDDVFLVKMAYWLGR